MKKAFGGIIVPDKDSGTLTEAGKEICPPMK
jgi:hypothetical protein